MHILIRYKWTWLLLLIALLMAGYLAASTWASRSGELPVIGEVQNFSLENVNGNTVSLNDTAGKVRLVYFFFTECPDVCPITTFTLSKTQELLKEKGSFGTDAAFLSISFDPQNDTRQKIKEFADRFNADYSGWYFLRGDQEVIRSLAAGSFKILIAGTNKDNFAHANLIGLVDRNNRLRALYDAGNADVTPDYLADAVTRLVRE